MTREQKLQSLLTGQNIVNVTLKESFEVTMWLADGTSLVIGVQMAEDESPELTLTMRTVRSAPIDDDPIVRSPR